MLRDREWKPVEVGDGSDVLDLVEEVRGSKEPRLLQRDGEELAVVIPVGLARSLGLRGPRTAEDDAAFRAAAGSWNDIDTDKLLADIYADRRRSARPSVEQ